MSKQFAVVLFAILATLLDACGGGSADGYHCPSGTSWAPQSVSANNPHGFCTDGKGSVVPPVANVAAQPVTIQPAQNVSDGLTALGNSGAAINQGLQVLSK